MLHRIRTLFTEDPLRALLEGDVVFFKDGDDDGDGGGSGSGSGGSSQGDDDDTDDDDAGSSKSKSGGSDDDDDDDDDDAGPQARRASRQAKRYRRQLRDTQAELATLKKQMEDLQAAGDKDGGKVDEKTKQERDDAISRAQKAEARIARIERERTVTSVISSLKVDGKQFGDPDVILAMAESGRIDDLDPDDEDGWEKADVKAALRALGKAKPHLLSESSTEGDGRQSNGNGNSGGGKGTNAPRSDRTNEEIDKLPIGQRAGARLSRAFASKK